MLSLWLLLLVWRVLGPAVLLLLLLCGRHGVQPLPHGRRLRNHLHDAAHPAWPHTATMPCHGTLPEASPRRHLTLTLPRAPSGSVQSRTGAIPLWLLTTIPHLLRQQLLRLLLDGYSWVPCRAEVAADDLGTWGRGRPSLAAGWIGTRKPTGLKVPKHSRPTPHCPGGVDR